MRTTSRNLPDGAIVEVPGVLSAAGVLGIGVGELPEGAAELCRREITATRLCVDAAVNGDRQAALQCLLLDPVITDMDVARAVLDDYLTSYRQYLPRSGSRAGQTRQRRAASAARLRGRGCACSTA